MIEYDRKMKKAALKLTDKYNDLIMLADDGSHLLLMSADMKTIKSVPTHVPPEEAPSSIKRLCDAGLFLKHKIYMGSHGFSITPLLKHQFAFWFDEFSKRFLCGYIAGLFSGVFIAVIGGLLLAYTRSRLGI